METLIEERDIDHLEDSGEEERPTESESNDSDTDHVSVSANFQRGHKMTRSLGRSFKNLEFGKSTLSVSEGKSESVFGRFFNQIGKKDSKKEKIVHLEKICENLSAKNQRHLEKIDRQQNDYKKLADQFRKISAENIDLKEKHLKLEKEIERTKNDYKLVEQWNKEIIYSVGKALKSYGETFEKFDFDDYDGRQREESFSVDNLQIGSGNTQNIITADLKLLHQYQKNLENIMQELKQTKQNLQISKLFQENMGNQILTLDGVLEEVKCALTDVKNTKKQDVFMELLDYTLSWTEPKLMSECVYELQNLPEKSSDYLFKDLKGNAKIGVLRIFKKYEKRLNYRQFAQRLEMDAVIDQEIVCADIPLTKDDCASLLVRWVKLHQENDARTLVERFPRIKPGGSEIKRDKVMIPFPNASYSTESLNSNDDLAQKSEHFRERLIKDVKDIVMQEIHGLKTNLEEIKSAVIYSRSEPRYV